MLLISISSTNDSHLLDLVRLTHMDERTVRDTLVKSRSDFERLDLLRQHSGKLFIDLLATSQRPTMFSNSLNIDAIRTDTRLS